VLYPSRESESAVKHGEVPFIGLLGNLGCRVSDRPTGLRVAGVSGDSAPAVPTATATLHSLHGLIGTACGRVAVPLAPLPEVTVPVAVPPLRQRRLTSALKPRLNQVPVIHCNTLYYTGSGQHCAVPRSGTLTATSGSGTLTATGSGSAASGRQCRWHWQWHTASAVALAETGTVPFCHCQCHCQWLRSTLTATSSSHYTTATLLLVVVAGDSRAWRGCHRQRQWRQLPAATANGAFCHTARQRHCQCQC